MWSVLRLMTTLLFLGSSSGPVSAPVCPVNLLVSSFRVERPLWSAPCFTPTSLNSPERTPPTWYPNPFTPFTSAGTSWSEHSHDKKLIGHYDMTRLKSYSASSRRRPAFQASPRKHPPFLTASTIHHPNLGLIKFHLFHNGQAP